MSHPTFQIGRGAEHLELELLERTAPDLPTAGDVRVRATVRLQDFRGSYSDVWLERDDLEAFVQELRTLVATREGTARLEAMSPGELDLELRFTDRPEQLEASVSLGRHQFSGPTYWPTSVSGGFELEPGQLSSILAGFEVLLGEPDAGA